MGDEHQACAEHDGPLLSKDELAKARVRWPTTTKDRAPRYATTLTPTTGQIDYRDSSDDAISPERDL